MASASVEGAVAKVLVEREGEGQPPLPAAQPHVPGEVRVRGGSNSCRARVRVGLRVTPRTCAARWASLRAAAVRRGNAARTRAPGVRVRGRVRVTVRVKGYG